MWFNLAALHSSACLDIDVVDDTWDFAAVDLSPLPVVAQVTFAFEF